MLNYIGKIIFRNKGIGAGGANTNILGKTFEAKTDNEKRLVNFGYIKQQFTNKKDDFYLYKNFEDKKIIFTSQGKFKKYMKNKYNIESFRNPDEAYIIEYKNGKKILKILEKKEQYREGSIEIKLWAGPSLKREYQIIFNNYFEIQYNFCINEFLKKKIISNISKYITLNQILKENNIFILFGDDIDYFEKLDNWINNS